MLLTLVLILLVLWLLGAFAFKIGGAVIHLLLVIAVIVLLVRFFTGRKVV